MAGIVQVIVDSSADIPQDKVDSLGIHVLPLAIHFGEESFLERKNITSEQFYQRLEAEAPRVPKTSHPSQGEFEVLYRDVLARGHEVVSIHLSDNFSGTYQTALAAARAVGDDAPITVVDSRNVSMCVGWLAIAAARAARQGATRPEIKALVTTMIPRLRLPAFLGTLDYIRYSGRIGKASAYLGTLLNIKPIVHVKGGELLPLEKVRTHKRALKRLVTLVEQLAPFEEVCVVHTHCLDTAQEVAERIAGLHPRERILIAEAGVAMGCHIGPGAVGVAALRKSVEAHEE